MNLPHFTLARMKPTAKALRGCEVQLTRIAVALEQLLAREYGIHMQPHHADTSGAEPEALYTDEEKDFLQEWKERTGKVGRDEEDPYR